MRRQASADPGASQAIATVPDATKQVETARDIPLTERWTKTALKPRDRWALACGLNAKEIPTPSTIRQAFATSDGGEQILSVLRLLKAEDPRLDPPFDINAILRLSARALIDPKLARTFVPRLAALDGDFMAQVLAGDAARDRHAWGEAEFHYGQGLQLYPNHMGYRVQYAHALKEDNKFADAAVHYMGAFGQGETSAEMLGFIEYTQHRRGGAWSTRVQHAIVAYWSGHGPFDPLLVPPCLISVDLLVRLFLHRVPSINEVGDHLSVCASIGELCQRLVSLDDFAKVNRDLLSLVACKGRSLLA